MIFTGSLLGKSAGTSTFDGYAVAYAVMSAICSSIQCRCMFATHYHMLSEDLLGLASVSLYHMACIPMETGYVFKRFDVVELM